MPPPARRAAAIRLTAGVNNAEDPGKVPFAAIENVITAGGGRLSQLLVLESGSFNARRFSSGTGDRVHMRAR
jgi:hypothetical protein